MAIENGIQQHTPPMSQTQNVGEVDLDNDILNKLGSEIDAWIAKKERGERVNFERLLELIEMLVITHRHGDRRLTVEFITAMNHEVKLQSGKVCSTFNTFPVLMTVLVGAGCSLAGAVVPFTSIIGNVAEKTAQAFAKTLEMGGHGLYKVGELFGSRDQSMRAGEQTLLSEIQNKRSSQQELRQQLTGERSGGINRLAQTNDKIHRAMEAIFAVR